VKAVGSIVDVEVVAVEEAILLLIVESSVGKDKPAAG